MDINYIECFLTVARTLNFSEAARQSYISQSMVSRYIDKIEKELDVRLFIRTNKEVSLTAEGRAFLPYANELVSSMREAKFALSQLKSGYEGRIKIGCDIASGTFMMKCAREFSEKYPGIAVDFKELRGGGEGFDGNDCDCMFLLRDMLPDNDNIEYVITHEDRLCLAVPREMSGERFSPARLGSERFVLLSEAENPILYMEIMDIFRAERISPEVVSRPDSIGAVLIAVGAKMGVTLLPSEVLRQSMTESVAAVELADIDTSLVYAAAWNKQSANSAAKLFWDIVKKYERGEEYEY